MARLGSKRIWRQWSESVGEFPTMASDAMDWDDMPQVGSDFHWRLTMGMVDEEGLGGLFGPEDAALLRPLNVEGDDSPDGGTVHYY